MFLLCLPLLASFIYLFYFFSYLVSISALLQKVVFLLSVCCAYLKSMDKLCYTLYFHNSLDFNTMVPHCYCSVTKLSTTLCNPMDCSTPGFPILHHLPELAQTHVHRDSDAIQPSHPLSSPSPPAFNFSQHQALFQSVSSLHQMARVLELQLQHQSFQ